MRPILIPEYFSDFSCIGGACEDTCCAGWNITVDKKTYQNYRKVKHPEISEKLQHYVKRNRKQNDDSNYAKLLLDENKNCHMMLEDGLCGIHKELGEQFLCNTCATYPRQFTKVGSFVEKSLTLSCPEAARVVLLREDGLGFIETEEPKDTRGLIGSELNLNKHPLFWDIRVFTIQLMQNRKQPIEIRLIILGLFIQKIEQLKQSDLEQQLPIIMEDYLKRLDNDEFIESLKNVNGNLNFQLNLARDLIRYRMSVGSSEKYLTILYQLIEGLLLEEDENKEVQDMDQSIAKYNQSYLELYEPFMKKQGYMLENYIVNYVFKNLFPFDYNTMFESYMMLVIHFTLIKLHMIGMAAKQQKLTQEMVIECIQQLAKEIEHNSTYLQGVRKGMEDSGYTTMGHMFVMISK
ncbi:flagellin lysine-N-methylase [Lysinibacillus sp. CD3-6]|uniref:flagellin lysine-N-methylase n=1 Tax=Lysinibacillus sp. CD3-6 TaxID=2892541 RepID=UPI00116B8FD7|nr:flagellin lysine-N-methylase [Lysinibacillus sp. CD3-6]UED80931.1 flagellin lysine-N-methylase [Lysinibacillus sp. CD3-6]